MLLSATEGEDKPLKYPTIFNSSDVAMITKMDMAEAAEFDVEAARRNIERCGRECASSRSRRRRAWDGGGILLPARVPCPFSPSMVAGCVES